MYHKVNIMVF